MKNDNEVRVVASDSSKRYRAAKQRLENPDGIKNHKDCMIRYCSEKQLINTVLSGKVFRKSVSEVQAVTLRDIAGSFQVIVRRPQDFRKV